jgi:hypothetical protein
VEWRRADGSEQGGTCHGGGGVGDVTFDHTMLVMSVCCFMFLLTAAILLAEIFDG